MKNQNVCCILGDELKEGKKDFTSSKVIFAYDGPKPFDKPGSLNLFSLLYFEKYVKRWVKNM